MNMPVGAGAKKPRLLGDDAHVPLRTDRARAFYADVVAQVKAERASDGQIASSVWTP